MPRKTSTAPAIVLLLGFAWLVSKCGGSSENPSYADNYTAPASVAAPVETQAETMTVSAAALNQRSSPDGPVAGKLAGGDTVSVYERRGNWSRVSPEGASPLWISSTHLCAGTGCYSPPKRKSNNSARHSPRGNTSSTRRSRSNYSGSSSCPCSGNHVCIGPRGGRYCITSGGNKRYGV